MRLFACDRKKGRPRLRTTSTSEMGQKQTKCTAVKRAPFDRPVREPGAKDALADNSRCHTGELWRRLSARLQFVLYQGRAGHPLRAEPWMCDNPECGAPS